jgi:YVTN family beta-propeller protein
MTRSRLACLLALLLLPAFVHAGPSNSLLDVHPDGTKLLVVNADNGTVTLVDLKTRKAVREVKLGDKPEGVTWIADTAVAAATVYRDDHVIFFDTGSGKVLDKVKVTDEPYGIVATKDGSKAYVTLEYPGKVAEIDVKSRKVLREIPAGSHVRGIALSPDEKRVYVTEFYTGVLNAIDLESGKIVDSWKGHSTDNLSRHVVVHPKRPKAYLSHIRSKVTVNHGDGSIFPHLSICDLVPAEKKKERRASIGMDTYNGVYVTCNPWEAAISPDGKRLYTIYAGTDDMNVNTVVDDDYKEITRSGGPRQLGKNPRAIRVSPDGKEVYVSNALDFTVTVHDADMRKLETIKVCDPPKSAEWVRGKVLFNTAKSPMTSRRWIACSSCHPDGHHDGRVWKNPEGMRRTPPMFGVAHTHPLHYSADRDEVQDFEYTIKGPLMAGFGFIRSGLKPKSGFKPVELEMTTSGKSNDLDALAIYNNSFEFTLSPHVVAPGKLSAEAARGKVVFFDKEVGCAKCHSGPYYSDSSLKKPFNLHDVGTGGDPDEKMGPKYDTPTLLGVYRSAPYLHHGKAKTLLDVLTTQNKDDKHGKTSHLKKEQLEDLVAFLKALPYETPPDETPNTVKYRFVAPKKKE